MMIDNDEASQDSCVMLDQKLSTCLPGNEKWQHLAERDLSLEEILDLEADKEALLKLFF